MCRGDTIKGAGGEGSRAAATQFGDGAGSGSGILPWAPNGEEDEIEKREDQGIDNSLLEGQTAEYNNSISFVILALVLVIICWRC